MSEVKKIESQHQSVDVLTAGVDAGLSISNISKNDIHKDAEYYFE